MKRITSLFLTFAMLFSLGNCLAGCEENAMYNNTPIPNDTPNHNSTPSDPASIGENKAQPPTLQELTSTGEIPYSNYCSTIFESNLYGNYSEYFDTELFLYVYNDKYGYADESGNIVIKEQFDEAGLFSENKAFVKKDGIWSVIDPTGNLLHTLSNFESADPNVWSSTLFQNGVAVMAEKVFTADLNILKIYALTADFKLSVATIEDAAGLTEMKTINTPEFSGVLTYNKIIGTGDHAYTLYNTEGTVIWTVTADGNKVLEKYNKSTRCTNGRGPTYHLNPFIVQAGYINVPNEDGSWGLLDLQTKEYLIDCTYEYVGALSEGLIAVSSYGKWGYVDANGVTQITPSYGFTTDFRNGRAFVVTMEGLPCVIDTTGNVVAEYNVDWPVTNYRVFRPSSDSDITVVTYGYYAYDEPRRSGKLLALTKRDVYVFDNYGNVLLHRGECKDLYVSDDFLFVDQEKMYKIA